MRDKDLYTRILGIEAPSQVANVDLRLKDGEVVVVVEYGVGESLSCPRCGSTGPGYDSRTKRWRHLDTCQYRKNLKATVHRMTYPEHGVVQVAVPWAEPGSWFSAVFETLVIDWLRETTIAAVSRLLGLSWNSVCHIMKRAVGRGLSRREPAPSKHLAIDETAFRKRHDYVTAISDSETGVVLHVAQDRRKASVIEWFAVRDDSAVTSFDALPQTVHQTSRASPIKEQAMTLRGYVRRAWEAKAWKHWYLWAIRSRLEPIQRVARMITAHLSGIINAIVLKVTSAPAESLNSRINMARVRSRGFRNKERFAKAIYLHLRGRDFYPSGVR